MRFDGTPFAEYSSGIGITPRHRRLEAFERLDHASSDIAAAQRRADFTRLGHGAAVPQGDIAHACAPSKVIVLDQGADTRITCWRQAGFRKRQRTPPRRRRHPLFIQGVNGLLSNISLTSAALPAILTYTNLKLTTVNGKSTHQGAAQRAGGMVKGQCRRRCGMGPGVAERTGNTWCCPQ